MKSFLFTDFYLYMRDLYDIIIIGAGACGLFTAINIAEKDIKKRILILEKRLLLKYVSQEADAVTLLMPKLT